MKRLSLAVTMMLVAACTAGGSGRPDWIMRGGSAINDGGKQVFIGVGMVKGIRNLALARSTADNRARADLSKIFETYSASLMKDYMASTTAGDMSAVSEEQHVEQAIKTFSANTLSGVQITERWEDPKDGTLYALAKLDLNAFQDSMDKMKELSTQVRDYIRKNAERVHMDLEKEEAKH